MAQAAGLPCSQPCLGTEIFMTRENENRRATMSPIGTSWFGCMMLRGLVYLSPAGDMSRESTLLFRLRCILPRRLALCQLLLLSSMPLLDLFRLLPVALLHLLFLRVVVVSRGGLLMFLFLPLLESLVILPLLDG